MDDNRLTPEELERNRELYRQVAIVIKEQQKTIDRDCGRMDYPMEPYMKKHHKDIAAEQQQEQEFLEKANMIICDGCGKIFNDSITCPYCGEMEVEHPLGDKGRSAYPNDPDLRGKTKECIVMDDMSFENNMFEDADILLEEDFH